MATVAVSLTMFDQMIKPLQQVNQALNLTIISMNNMNNVANRYIGITNRLNADGKAIQSANLALSELSNVQDRTGNGQGRLNNLFSKGADVSNNLIGKVKGIAAAYLNLDTIKKGFNLAIAGAARFEQQIITLSGMLGNKEVGRAYFGELNKYANESAYGIKEFGSITRQFIPFTKNPDNLMKLNKTSERLALLNPDQGLEGAGFALKEAMGGDFTSLKGRFGFGDMDIGILQSAKSMGDLINKFNILLNKKGATEQVLQEFNKSFIAQLDNVKSNIGTSFAQAGINALVVLKPILAEINQGFKDGKYQPFFDGLSTGITVVANIFAWGFGIIRDSIDTTIDCINSIADIFYNLGIILLGVLPIILGVAAAWGIYNLIVFITGTLIPAVMGLMAGFSFITLQLGAALSLAIIKQRLFHFVMSLNPIGLVIGLIVGLISAMLAFGAITNGIRETFAGAFGYIVDIAQWAINSIVGILNGAIKGINKVSGFFGDLLGIDAKKIQEIEYKADFSKFKESGQDFIKNATLDDVKAKFGLDKIGQEANQFKIPNTPDMTSWNKVQDPGQLPLGGLDNGSQKHLENISDKIDVSNEHLEMLRDLAEAQSIQNFVSLTPTVQVTTGDIKEEADINKIIAKIETYMETELANSAEGVYA
ncbi:hypothetical protein JOC70_000348 [Clostridium pascui]|uniref:hypothetical protein n=1 Tax=Clostridium pascui TaxID=46609 RepID=UPI00195B980F|nr:hypothetical protein [Clostridium pascui]MBM7868879.1 hypothetical protein [Clostridium pascui]